MTIAEQTQLDRAQRVGLLLVHPQDRPAVKSAWIAYCRVKGRPAYWVEIRGDRSRLFKGSVILLEGDVNIVAHKARALRLAAAEAGGAPDLSGLEL